MANKQVSFMLAPRVFELLEKLKISTRLTLAQMVGEGVKILTDNPGLILDLPEHPYGSGKKPKVFNLPEETNIEITRLAVGTTRSHVLEVALRALSDKVSASSKDPVGAGRHLLELISDEALCAEMRRRGLK